MTRPDDAPEPEEPSEQSVEQPISADPVEQPVQVRRDAEVGEWDAVEQAIVVDLDDDYDH